MEEPTTTEHAHEHEETAAQARARAQAAHAAITQALAGHRCRIVPTLAIEAIGAEPVGKALVSAGWMVLPQ